MKFSQHKLNNFGELFSNIKRHIVRFTMLLCKSLVTVLCLNLCIGTCHCGSNVTDDKGKAISNHTTNFIDEILKDYDKIVPPPDEKPLVASIGYFIIGFSDISERNMDFTLSYYMRMMWLDSRLNFSREEHGNIAYVTLNPEQMNEIWRPDPFYRNERGKSISQDFSLSEGFSRIYSSGKVFLSRKLETTFRCHMSLYDYPFDTQICSMDIGSYALTVEVLDIDSMDPENPVELHREVELVSFDLLGFSVRRYNETFTTGTYPAVKIDFTFKRNVGFYILQVNQSFFAPHFR